MPNELQTNAAALVAAMASPQAARIHPVIDGQAEHVRAALDAADTNLDANWCTPCGAGNVTVSNAASPGTEDFRVYTKWGDPVDFERVTMSAEQARPLITYSPKADLLRFETPGVSVGRLWVDADGIFQFEGNVGESARILFEALTTLSEQSRKGN